MNIHEINFNILISGDERFSLRIRDTLNNLHPNSFEDFSKTNFSWAYTQAKRNIKPIHLIIHNLEGRDFREEPLYIQSRNQDKINTIPILFISNCSQEILDPDVAFSLTPIEQEDLEASINNLIVKNYPNGINKFSIKKNEKYISITLPIDLTAKTIEDLKQEIEKYYFNSNPKGVALLNFRNIQLINNNRIREIFQVITNFRKNGKKIASFNMRKITFDAITKQGIEKHFNHFPSSNLALKNFGIEVKIETKKFLTLNVDIINPFISKSLDCFSKRMFINFEPTSPSKRNIHEFNHDLTAIIDFKVDDSLFYIAYNFKKTELLKMIIKNQSIDSSLNPKIMMSNIMSILKDVSVTAQQVLQNQNYNLNTPRLQVISNIESMKNFLANSLMISIKLQSDHGNCEMLIATKKP